MNDWSIIAYKKRIKEKEKAGIRIIRLEIGAPDFDTPEGIKNVAREALNKGCTSYTDPKGVSRLREEICEYYYRTVGKEFSPKDNIIVTPGSKYAIFSALHTLLKKNEDKVLLFDPYWMDYVAMCQILNKKFITVPLIDDGNRYYFDEETFKENISKEIKVIILNSPHHPTGKIFSKEELKFIADIAEDNQLFIISDEIYEKIRFTEDYWSILNIVDNMENVIMTNGFSKAYAMAGWRVGYAISSKKIIDKMTEFQIYTTRCPNSIAQYAAVTAIQYDEIVENMIKKYRIRRDALYKILNDLDNVRCTNADGTFYLFANFSSIGNDSYKMVNELLENGVSTLPGTLFGENWGGYIRFALTTNLSDIKMVDENLKQWIDTKRGD